MKATKKKVTKKETKGQKKRGSALQSSITKLMKPAPKVKENTLWTWFREGVTAALQNFRGENRLSRLHMVRVENTTGAGFSDVEGAYNGTGFIAELKTLARPELQDKRKVPTLSIPHFTTAQALFLDARWIAGERSWLFVQVGDTRYLVPGNKASRFLKPFKESELSKASVETLLGDSPMDFLLAMVGK